MPVRARAASSSSSVGETLAPSTPKPQSVTSGATVGSNAPPVARCHCTAASSTRWKSSSISTSESARAALKALSTLRSSQAESDALIRTSTASISRWSFSFRLESSSTAGQSPSRMCQVVPMVWPSSSTVAGLSSRRSSARKNRISRATTMVLQIHRRR